MIKYIVKQSTVNNLTKDLFYAYPVIDETIDLAGLVKHMDRHNSGFSEAMCVGVIKAMVKCIKELVLDGKNVKIDDLAIFSCGIKNGHGATSAKEFTAINNIKGLKLRARATGTLRASNLDIEAALHRVNPVSSTTAEEANPVSSTLGEE